MNFGFPKRLAAGLAISTPLVIFLATAPLRDMSPRQDPPPATQSESSTITPASADAGKEYTLAEAFESQTSELLWFGSLNLDRQSADTFENVRLSAEAVDLTAVRPDEVFSFNGTVGMRTEAKGYRPGLMYSNGDVVMGLGGGICITATQLYKAALESGLKLIERHPHSGPVSYANPGRDAAVSFGWADLRFKNDTGNVILIRCTVRENELIVAFYGKNRPGRTVEIVSEDLEVIPFTVVEKEDVMVPEGETKVVQQPHAGYSVTTVRVIRQDGKVISREVLGRDTVLPRNKIIHVPPAHKNMPKIELPFDLTKPQDGTLPLPDSSPLPLPTSDLTEPTASQ